MKSFYYKQLNNPTYEVGVIWFPLERILCSNVKRANICWKTSLFFFILKNHVTGNFWWRAFWIFFATGKLLVLVMKVFFFAKGGNTVYNSYRSWMLWFLMKRNTVCCMNASSNKLKHAFLAGLALKGGCFFTG